MGKIQNYFQLERGDVPVLLSCPHGGFKKPLAIPNRKINSLPDRNTLFFARRIIYLLKTKNIKIYYILSKIHRNKIDLNRPPGSFSAFDQNNSEAREIHYYFHKQIKNLAKECVSQFDRCLVIDLHGFTKPRTDYCDIILGNIFSNTLAIKTGSSYNDYRDFWGLSQIVTGLSKNFSLDDGLGVTKDNLGYSGGYITHQFYRKERINAIQLELGNNIRNNLKLANQFVNDFTSAIIKSIE
jgi:N-formylglutamate amidohydrolase